MTGTPLKIDVLLCTFRRAKVAQTLQSLDRQVLSQNVEMRIVVSDNDESPSAKVVVAETSAQMRTAVHYQHAPMRNISLARNAGLDTAAEREADWVAFLDDDEVADPDWLSSLLQCAMDTDADAVFGPAVADYGITAPEWMRRQDHHSNRPERRDGVVQTGHTCNALLRWKGTPWDQERFDLARGRTGGEDTEFFFRLHHLGAQFEICDSAVVRERVEQSRLSLRWLLRRKYRSGQSYVAGARGPGSRIRLALLASAKMMICGGFALAGALSANRRNFWLLRGALHAGVVADCLSLRQPEIYGAAAED